MGPLRRLGQKRLWSVSHTCSGRGAPVDQARAACDPDPHCPYCREPVAHEPFIPPMPKAMEALIDRVLELGQAVGVDVPPDLATRIGTPAPLYLCPATRLSPKQPASRPRSVREPTVPAPSGCPHPSTDGGAGVGSTAGGNRRIHQRIRHRPVRPGASIGWRAATAAGSKPRPGLKDRAGPSHHPAPDSNRHL